MFGSPHWREPGEHFESLICSHPLDLKEWPGLPGGKPFELVDAVNHLLLVVHFEHSPLGVFGERVSHIYTRLQGCGYATPKQNAHLCGSILLANDIPEEPQVAFQKHLHRYGVRCCKMLIDAAGRAHLCTMRTHGWKD